MNRIPIEYIWVDLLMLGYLHRPVSMKFKCIDLIIWQILAAISLDEYMYISVKQKLLKGPCNVMIIYEKDHR